MMAHPASDTLEREVERVAARDFGQEPLPEVLNIIREYGRREDFGRRRVHPAKFKLAKWDFGNLSPITAIRDLQGVVGVARSPHFVGPFDQVGPCAPASNLPTGTERA